jgi:hypothetical protein
MIVGSDRDFSLLTNESNKLNEPAIKFINFEQEYLLALAGG